MFDYFCFSVPNLHKNDFVVYKSDSKDFAESKLADLKLFNDAKKMDKLIVFNRKDEKFYKNNQEIDITNMRIFPKCYIPYINQLLTNLEKHNAKSIVTIDDFNKTLHWPNYFQPDNRPAKLTTYGDFKLNYSTYKQLFPNLFLKTVKKGLHIKNLKYGQ